MKKYLWLLILLIPFNAYSLRRSYSPGMWRKPIEATRFHVPIWPATPFLGAEVTLDSSEPPYGYPMHSGIVKGVSDTIDAIIEFRNQSTSDYTIGSQSPENWFVPAIYSIYANVETEAPQYDTSMFDYAFRFWGGSIWKKTTKPTKFYREGNDSTNYSLRYSLWNLPVGEYRVIFKKTSSAPANLVVINGWGREQNLILVVEPQNVADTINAKVQTFWRANYAGNASVKLSLANSILSLNPRSIVGYKLLLSTGGDSATQVARLDSIIAFCTNLSDRALPDSSQLNIYHRGWLSDVLTDAQWMREGIVTPDSVIKYR